MAKVKLEIQLETFEFLKNLVTEINKKDVTKIKTMNEDGTTQVTSFEDKTKFPFWTVDHTVLTAVPPGEGDMQEFWFKGDKVYGNQVKEYCDKHNIDVSYFFGGCQHVCDHKEVEQFEGFFFTEDECQKYIEENRDKYKYPYPMQMSFDNNEQMKKLVKALFEIVDIEPNERFKDE